MTDHKDIIRDYGENIENYYENEKNPVLWYPMFYRRIIARQNVSWVKENHEKFIRNTPNEILYNRWFGSEMGPITSLTFSCNGYYIIVGHASGAIQMRHGSTGVVLCTLRNIQFPPKPIYALEYSRFEERVCYAACTDGAVYRIDIPNLVASTEDPPQYCIRADPALEYLNTQYYGAPGISSAAAPFITHRSAALSLGLSADEAKFIVGYADSSIKVYDIETQEVETTYKVHKLRLQFIPKKLQRMHAGQVCALRCHDERPRVFASAAWDNTLRVWDTRCPVGCVATFEGVDVCSDSIDINRDHCVVGSWLPTEALTVWDIVARKRLNIIRVQNRRPNVDGEFIYACRYWRSSEYNRKGKYAIIGGSGTNCVEVINLHNRYITCSYPTSGTVLAITSHKERIAFGGTAPVLSIVSFHDPKHEKYGEVEPEYEFTKGERYFSDSSSEILPNQDVTKLAKASSISAPAMAVKSSVSQKLK
ncbi:uncharacterized protein LOC125053229 isoform X2 [Pieris napi]|uniref:uncharacterized protein LOC125053229 isoform X2 n=1 Tax=Pieris napi TaxID=78633 RepID=UPI001FB9B916|nr:uncharacterized protein LOC125053229 isoform X2 [Pieris napi]